MLERATGCLENAGRRVFHDANGVIRNKCSIPSHFKSHSDIGKHVPSWFLALLHASGHRSSAAPNTQHENKGFSDGIKPSLEFLYPQRARSIVSSPLIRTQKRTRPRRRSLGSGFSRSYVAVPSLSQDTAEVSYSQQDGIVRTEGILNLQYVQEYGQASANLHAFLEKNGTDYEKAWVLYLAAGRPQNLKSLLCAYMSKSRRPKERALTWKLFNQIPPKDRTESDFRSILRSQTSLSPGGKPTHLEHICAEAMSTHTPFLEIVKLCLVHMVKNRQWSKINYAWGVILRNTRKDDLVLESLLAPFNRFEFPDYSFSRHLSNLVDSLKKNKHGPIYEFARLLVQRFVASADLLRLTPVTTLLPLVRHCHSVGILNQQQYSDLILHFFNEGEARSEFVKCILLYHQFRSVFPDEKPVMRANILNMIIVRASEFGMTESYPYFLDEVSRFWGKPFRKTYKNAMNAFAEVGDVAAVYDLFKRCLADYGKPHSPKWVSPLLLVHARLAEIDETRRLFDRMTQEFNLEPNFVCWNILVLAHSKAGDAQGALEVLAQMRKNQVQHTPRSLGPLMALFAKRGDIDSVRTLFRYAQKHEVEITRPMLDTAVDAYIKNGKLTEAEELVETTWHVGSEGSPVRMWNALLVEYAIRVSKHSFRRILDRMEKLGLKPDAMTYAAMMLAFVHARQTDRARTILRRMYEAGIEPTEQHFSILLFGYGKERNRDMVHVIFEEMQTRFYGISIDASLAQLRMQIARDLENAHDDRVPSHDTVLLNAERAVMRSIARYNSHPVSVSRPGLAWSDLSIHDRKAFTALHFEQLIQAYGTRAAPERALELLRYYMANMGHDLKSIPLGFVVPLMFAHLRAHNFRAVEECWDLILSGVYKVAGTFHLDEELDFTPSQSVESALTSAKPSKILHANRFILDRPISLYIRSLACLDEFEKIHQVVNDVQEAGFEMSGFNWSTYIEVLATSKNDADNRYAFKLFEEKFISHFPGWSWFIKGYGIRPIDAPVTLLHLDGRWGATKSRRMMGKLARRQWRKIRPDYMHPHYPTMLHLASTLRQFRRRSVEEGSSHLEVLHITAPKTLRVLAKLPARDDRYQAQILRGKAEKPALLASPIKLHSTSSGALGPYPRLKKRTFEDATQEPFHFDAFDADEPSSAEGTDGLNNFGHSDSTSSTTGVVREPSNLDHSAVDELGTTDASQAPSDPDLSAVKGEVLTGLVSASQQEELVGSVWKLLSRKDRITLESELHEHHKITTRWAQQRARYKRHIAAAYGNRDIALANIMRRKFQKIKKSRASVRGPEAQLFDKLHRKWKVQPPSRLFKTHTGLHVKPGPRKLRPKYRRSWAFKDDSEEIGGEENPSDEHHSES